MARMEGPVGMLCPMCNEPPALAFAEQAFCGNDSCQVMCWNPTLTIDENLDDSQVIDLWRTAMTKYEFQEDGWIGVHLIICSNMGMDYTPGSTPLTAICGCPVWVSPTGMAAVMDRRQATEIVCWNHAPSGAIKDMFSNRKTSTVKGARRELSKTLGWQEAERVARQFNFGKEY